MEPNQAQMVFCCGCMPMLQIAEAGGNGVTWMRQSEILREILLCFCGRFLALQRRRAEIFLSAPRAGIYGLCSNWRPQDPLLR